MLSPLCEVAALQRQTSSDFGIALAKMNVTEGHFYTDNGQIPVSNVAALKAL
jgi:hypothetical protein